MTELLWTVVGLVLLVLQAGWNYLDSIPRWWVGTLLGIAALHHFGTRVTGAITGAIYLHGRVIEGELKKLREHREYPNGGPR
jgi:hypothetical protein